MQLKRGANIGEYKIKEVIGGGSFSVVYKAEDTHLLRPVAIKQLSPEVFSEAGTREWFIREAQLAASLNHPNIVATYALREQGESLFLIMEYMPRGDLHTLISQKGPLDRSMLIKAASNICSALEMLHSRQVIHRDVKPENILIAEEDYFKLADFGLAHIRQANPHRLNNSSGPQPGTLLYMSPEQALGEKVTIQSDIYSLAVVLYEAMTGHYYLPYDDQSEDEEALLELIINEPPIYPDRHHPSVPLELADPLLHALDKDISQRPQTAREFLNEIKSAISRSKHVTLSKKGRPLDTAQPSLASPQLLRELYAVRTLRDALHQPAEAKQQLSIIWQTYPGVPEVAAEWGETLVALGRIEEGRDWLERAVRMNPRLPFAQLALADIYREIDENESEADNAVVEAIHADPDLAYAVLYEEIVHSLDDPYAYETYVATFKRAVHEEFSAPAWHNLGLILALCQGREEDSIAAFETALDLDPNYGPAYVGLGSILTEMNRLDRAIEVLEQATGRAFPVISSDDWHKANTVYQRSHAFLALAVAYVQAEQYENSAAAARTVLDIDPAELDQDAEELLAVYTRVAGAWLQDGEHLRAYRFLNQIVPLASQWGYVEAFTLLGIAQSKIGVEYRQKGQWNDAITWLNASLLNLQETNVHSREAQRLAAEVHSELKKALKHRIK